jgi:hypothetical protein
VYVVGWIQMGQGGLQHVVGAVHVEEGSMPTSCYIECSEK